jgi:hypothetical protein
MYEIVNKGLIILNGVYSGVARHNIIMYLGVCDYRRSMDWMLGLLTTCIHHSELQVITAVSLISTLYKSQQPPLSLFQPAVFTSRSLATASNTGDSSASCIQVLLSQPPVQNSCQLTTSWVPGWRPFYAIIQIFSSQADFQLTTALSTELSHSPISNCFLATEVSCLYHLGTEHVENIVLLLLHWCPLPRKHVYQTVAYKLAACCCVRVCRER